MADFRERRAAPPDGGWGWVVMLASLGALTIRTGLTWAAFPVLYADLIHYFHTSSAAVGWAGSIFSFCNFAVCLMATPFYEAYGSRLVGIVGTLLSSLGLLLTSFSPNLTTLCLAYGVIAGCGVGCLSFASLLPTQIYFTHKRPLAAGVSSMGVGLGQMLFPPLIRLFLDNYGWRGTTLLISALFLHCCLMCAAFRPLPRRPRPVSDVESSEKGLSVSAPSSPRLIHKRLYDVKQEEDMRHSQSLADIHSYLSKPEKHPVSDDSSKVDSPESIRKCSVRGVDASQTHTSCKIKLREFWTLLKENLYLLGDHSFSLYVTGNFFMNFGLWTIYTHFTNRAIVMGVSKQLAAVLTSLVGVANLLGRLVICSCSTWLRVERVWLFGCLVFLGGVFAATTAFAQTFLHQAIWAVLCGLTAGGALCLQITASTDMVGVEHAAQATSLLMVATSLAVLVALPLAGWLYDVSGSYDIPFVVNGLLQVVGACFVLSVMPCRRQPKEGHRPDYHLPDLVEVTETHPWKSTHSLAI